MTTVAGKFGKDVIYMTGYTTSIVIGVQFEQFVMVKTQGTPRTGLVTLGTA